MSEIKRWHPDNCGMVRHGDKSWEPEYDHNLSGLPYVRSDDHDAAIAAKDAEIERLRAALREYGNHVSPCATGRSPKLLKEFGLTRWPCTCGFDAALATAETEVKP